MESLICLEKVTWLMTVEKHDLFLSLEKPNLKSKRIQVQYFSSGFQILPQRKEVKILTLYTLYF